MEKGSENKIIETKILGNQQDYDLSRKILLFPEDKQKFYYYDNRVRVFDLLRVSETETHIYWSEDRFTPRFNGKLFYTTKGISGITLDKKTRDVKFWFGKRPNTYLLESFIARMNVSWWDHIPKVFQTYFSVSLFKAIAKNKINSVEEYSNYLSKHSLMFKGIDKKILCKCLYSLQLSDTAYVSIGTIGAVLKIAKDQDACIDLISKINLWWHEDLLKKAQMLDEKLDLSSETSMRNEKLRIELLYKERCEKYEIHYYETIPF